VAASGQSRPSWFNITSSGTLELQVRGSTGSEAFLVPSFDDNTIDSGKGHEYVTEISLGKDDTMWGLVAVIPIVCCVLIPAGIAVAAFMGFGKKKPNGNVSDGELPQDNLRHSSQLEEEKI